ncbi:MAG: ABC transporter ATP-binding protein [Actinobacteria bacterium]|nr:ABC transporter ATP-binding protein [Actinomycetota bacterium]
MSELAIEVSGLTKRFGDRTALSELDLAVPRRTAFGFLGPNGAGKTTLIRLLLGLIRPSKGSMRLLGLPLPEGRQAALARIGAIVEEPRFHAFLTGRENLAIVAAARDRQAQGRIDQALARVGLSERANDRVKSYSLGMRQRLGVARALLADPELLILDEPTNGLDPAGISEFRHMIRGFVDEGRTILLSSHLLDEVEKICDAVAIVDRGRVVVQGSIDELKASGERTVLIGTPDEVRAHAVLAGHVVVRSIERNGSGIRVTLASDLRLTTEEAAGELNRRLTAQGVVVQKLDPQSASLEERFLQITERLGATE